MKAFIEERKASVTIEAAIVTSVILVLILFMLTALMNEYMRVADYCGRLEASAKAFAGSDQGDILRIMKVVTDTGGRIADGVFKGK